MGSNVAGLGGLLGDLQGLYIPHPHPGPLLLFPGSGPTMVKSECPGALGRHLCLRTGLSSAELGLSPAQAGGAGPSSTCLCGHSRSLSAWDLPSSLPLEVLTLAPSPILLGCLCLSLSAAL